MKKILFILTAGIMFTGSLQAQIHLFIEEQEVNLSDGKSSAWVFPVTGTVEEALDDLKDYCKDRSDVKMKKGGDNLIIAEKVSLPIIATKRGDLIGFCYITEQYYTMALIFQLGYDISVNSREWTSEMQNFRNYTKAFMSYHYEQSYARRVKVLEKELKAVEKEKGQNENKINNLTNKINNLSKKIGKETETTKIEGYESEINTHEADIRQLMDTLPGLESKIADLKAQINENKTESNTYQSTIGAF
jgi:prefoldin subunit 5